MAAARGRPAPLLSSFTGERSSRGMSAENRCARSGDEQSSGAIACSCVADELGLAGEKSLADALQQCSRCMHPCPEPKHASAAHSPSAVPALSGETLLWRAHAAEGAAGMRHVGVGYGESSPLYMGEFRDCERARSAVPNAPDSSSEYLRERARARTVGRPVALSKRGSANARWPCPARKEAHRSIARHAGFAARAHARAS